jgi:hypothetical protein
VLHELHVLACERTRADDIDTCYFNGLYREWLDCGCAGGAAAGSSGSRRGA